MQKSELFFLIIVIIHFNYLESVEKSGCGIETTSSIEIFEGVANIETYPWLGLLFYPIERDNDLTTTTIVLITTQMALATALDIDRYPKTNFREMARVVLGQNCSVGPFLKVVDYTYHPDFAKTSFSTLAIVQLETKTATQVIRPICPPPAQLRHTEVYAMTLMQDCTSASVRVYKMLLVDPDDCKEFYRRSDLDISSMWPEHPACARAMHDDHCVWSGGTILVSRIKHQWRLLGIGIHGPGCGSPARFLDYGMYYPWVRRSLSRIGRPTITRIESNYVILRRSLNSLQRFGYCDTEETKTEIWSDTIEVSPEKYIHKPNQLYSYNLTLIANVDYSCVVLRALAEDLTIKPPTLKLRRICTNPYPLCYDFSVLQIDFAVEVTYSFSLKFKMVAYGQELKFIDVRVYRKYINRLFYGAIVRQLAVRKHDSRNHTYSPNVFVIPESVFGNLSFLQDPQKHYIKHVVDKNVTVL